MNSIEYIFTKDNAVHVLQTKPSTNSKLGFGYIVTTYHFDISQVIGVDLSLDNGSCFDCPFSFNMNGGKSGGCYTHKGLMRAGLLSMLKRLNKLYMTTDRIKEYNKDHLNAYVSASKVFNPILTRFGSYGEPVLLPLYVIGKLKRLSDKSVGYTHQWTKASAKGYSKYLMASTHNVFETAVANGHGWRAFEASEKMTVKTPLCPASKEAGKVLNCNTCGACGGTSNSKSKNIFIHTH